MAKVCKLTEPSNIMLNEVHAQVHLDRAEQYHDDAWYLDTGVSNHMSGCKASFTELDSNLKGSVKFGDDSVVDICGRGMVLFTCHNGEHRVLTDVYYIPRLRNNIVSQLNGRQMLIEDGTLLIHDQ